MKFPLRLEYSIERSHGTYTLGWRNVQHFIWTRWSQSVALLLLVCCSTGCTLEPGRLDADLDLPDQFSASAMHEKYESAKWWQSFNDPVLDRVVSEVLKTNLSLEEAVARVEQVRASAAQVNSYQLPRSQPLANVNDTDVPTNASIGKQLEDFGLRPEIFEGLGITTPERLPLVTYSVGSEFAYEADFWSRKRLAAKAAEADVLGAVADFQAARIGIIAETIQTFLDIAYLRSQRELLRNDIGILEEREALTQSRYSAGLKEARDVYVIRLQKWQTEATLPQLDGQLADAEGRLWILLGRYRSELDELLPQAELPEVELEMIPTGVPTDLLTQRPDVAAAKSRMEGANFALGARKAELFPALSLSGTIGVQSADSNDWLDPSQWFKNLSVNLLAPAFNGLRPNANVALADGRLKQAIAAYRQSVVSAVNEVETVLRKLESSKRRIELLQASVEEATTEARLKEERYGAGLASYEEVLAAREVQSSIQAEHLVAKRDLAYVHLALHRALGGKWEQGSTSESTDLPTEDSANSREDK